MAFQVSPGVQIREFDLTAIVPAISTTPAGYVGVFQWGPADQRVLINTEKQLESIFRKPANNAYYAVSWLLGSNFLSYGGNLQVVRNVKEIDSAITDNDLNSISNSIFPDYDVLGTELVDNEIQIKNREHYEAVTLGSPDAVFNSTFVGKYPGELINGCGVAIYTSGWVGAAHEGDSALYPQWAKDAGYKTTGVFGNLPSTTDQALSLGFSGDEIHVVIVDLEGKYSGVAGSVIEVFEGLSLASDAKKSDGSSNYWLSVLNNTSQIVWGGDVASQIQKSSTGLEWGSSFEGSTPGAFKTRLLNNQRPFGTVAFVMTGGKVAGLTSYDSSDPDVSSRILTQYENSFGDADESDVSLIIGYNTTSSADLNSLITIAENRKDSIVFISACYNLDLIGGTRADIMEGITNFVSPLNSTSYGAVDTGYKYQYDRFHNVYRYVPLCADIAGCAVRTDTQKDPWFSPAGYDRGRILNIVKLCFNPNKEERDVLYKNNINPVITSQGFGVILFGDKTLQKKPSAFDRINVRRLFNVLEKSIATAAKFQLFEFNDSFTRSQFKQLVEPFLRDIQGRRGVTSYAVVCDDSNNTPNIIDSNRFVADIFIAPNRSINFIQLNFIATPTGVTFAEYGG
jgi:hypothetical protein